jgi:hypothetical protein
MTLNSLFRKVKFSLNKRKHIKEYPFVSMIVLHHYFTTFGLDIGTLDEKVVSPPKDATVSESLPVHVYNAIHANGDILKYIEILESNIYNLYKTDNEWCLWMIKLFDNKVILNKSELQEVALLSHDSMAQDYIQWELKVHVPIAELIEKIEESISSNVVRNKRKRKNRKTK